MRKIYGAVRLTQAIIDAHKEGRPLNPNGVRGSTAIFTYEEVDTKWQRPSLAFGHTIRVTSTGDFVHAVNTALDEGREVKPSTARAMGSRLMVSIVPVDYVAGEKTAPISDYVAPEDEYEDKVENVDVEKEPHKVEQLGELNEPETEVPVQDETVSTDDKVEDGEPKGDSGELSDKVENVGVEASEGGEAAASEQSEVQTPAETQELPDTPAEKSDDTGQIDRDNEESTVDWGKAESFLKTAKNKREAKNQLAEYAKTFSVKLDKGEKFENMILAWKGELSD